MTNKPNIGWIGLGVMGSAMAKNVLKAGFEVAVFSRTRQKADSVLKAGAQWYDSPSAVAQDADIVCTMLGYPEDVESVVTGNEGVLSEMKPGSLLIDFTTSCPLLSEKIAEIASSNRIGSLDAPVSGGDIGAKNGTLAIMCGGERGDFLKAESFLMNLGDKIGHFGNAGSGQRVKMSNQILIASTMIGLVESMLYAERAGLEVEQVMDLISKGAAGCWSITELGPRIVRQDWAPGFYIKHFVKDMKIALRDVDRMGLKLEGLELAYRFYSMAENYDWDNNGTQALMKILRVINS
jgi:3-hydroxyisobutyrate dehydrogenase